MCDLQKIFRPLLHFFVLYCTVGLSSSFKSSWFRLYYCSSAHLDLPFPILPGWSSQGPLGWVGGIQAAISRVSPQIVQRGLNLGFGLTTHWQLQTCPALSPAWSWLNAAASGYCFAERSGRLCLRSHALWSRFPVLGCIQTSLMLLLPGVIWLLLKETKWSSFWQVLP